MMKLLWEFRLQYQNSINSVLKSYFYRCSPVKVGICIYSHSIVPGGLSVISRTTRLTCGVSAMILELILLSSG